MIGKQFEYRKVDLSGDDQDALTHLGRNGWELCGVSYNTVGYFKRELILHEGKYISRMYPEVAREIWENLVDGNYICLVEHHQHPFMRVTDAGYQHVFLPVERTMLDHLLRGKIIRKSHVVDGEYRLMKPTHTSTAKDKDYITAITNAMVNCALGEEVK